MDLLMFRVARCFGAVPFQLQKDGRTPAAFRWRSWSAVYFCWVAATWHFFFANNAWQVYQAYLR